MDCRLAAPQAAQRFLSIEISQHTVRIGLAQKCSTDIRGSQTPSEEFGEPSLTFVMPLSNSHVGLSDFSGKSSVPKCSIHTQNTNIY